MKYIRIIIIVVLGIIYIPINELYMGTQKWYFKMKHEDTVVYYLFTPFYWILVAITYIISAPYDWIQSFGIH